MVPICLGCDNPGKHPFSEIGGMPSVSPYPGGGEHANNDSGRTLRPRIRWQRERRDRGRTDGETAMKGFVVYDDAIKGKRAGIVMVPEWWGITKHIHDQAQKLAQQGYTAFIADI